MMLIQHFSLICLILSFCVIFHFFIYRNFTKSFYILCFLMCSFLIHLLNTLIIFKIIPFNETYHSTLTIISINLIILDSFLLVLSVKDIFYNNKLKKIIFLNGLSILITFFFSISDNLRFLIQKNDTINFTSLYILKSPGLWTICNSIIVGVSICYCCFLVISNYKLLTRAQYKLLLFLFILPILLIIIFLYGSVIYPYFYSSFIVLESLSIYYCIYIFPIKKIEPEVMKIVLNNILDNWIVINTNNYIIAAKIDGPILGNLTSLDLLNQKFDTISKYINKDQKIITVFDNKEKNLRHYELNTKKIIGKKSEKLGEIIMFHDVTLYKNAMNRIVKNSRIDKLTGIFNRDYYEKYIHEINFKNKTPLCYVAIDLNNLKFINDNYGHSKGDEYICYVSQRLLYIVNKYKGLLFRIGGDEFALIFKNTDDNRSNIITNDIDDLFSNCDENYPISIALGYSILKNESSQIKDIIIEADNNMYKNKLNSNKSTNNPLISLLRKVSKIHKYETDAHCQRVQNLCLSIGDNLSLDKNTLDDLSLLAQIHDIGKIGISDKILNKNDKLTTEEFDIMKTHTVLGYNIIKSFNHLNTVAIGILHHHEYYNGTGYPKGIKGKNIPLIARILAVVDTYDAMTNDRVYRKALTEEVAINELINKKEIQFDPDIVDLFVELQTKP